MSSVWAAFFVGCFIGFIVTLVAMSCLFIARHEDDDAQRLYKSLNPKRGIDR